MKSGKPLLASGKSPLKLLIILDAERAAGVYHREGRTGKYQLTYEEAKAVCHYEGGKLATYQQLEAARKIGMKSLSIE